MNTNLCLSVIGTYLYLYFIVQSQYYPLPPPYLYHEGETNSLYVVPTYLAQIYHTTFTLGPEENINSNKGPWRKQQT